MTAPVAESHGRLDALPWAKPDRLRRCTWPIRDPAKPLPVNGEAGAKKANPRPALDQTRPATDVGKTHDADRTGCRGLEHEVRRDRSLSPKTDSRTYANSAAVSMSATRKHRRADTGHSNHPR
jgi:hypothetical protein